MKILLLTMLLAASAAGQFTTFPQATGASSEVTVYAADKTSATSWTVTGATHGLGTCDFVWVLMDSSGNWIVPSTVTCDGSYDVTISFGVAQAGRLVFVKAGGSGGGGTTNHAALNNLTYAAAGHTGFAPTSHAHAGTDITSGTVPMARLASSGTCNSSTFLRGDGTCAAPAGTAANPAGDENDIQINGGGVFGARKLSSGLLMDSLNLSIDSTYVYTLSGTQTVTGSKTHSGTLQVSGAASVADFSGASVSKPARVASTAPSGSCEDGEQAVLATGVEYGCVNGTWATKASANNGVIGRSSLTTTNAIPKVSASGTLGNSTITDDGTIVTTTVALSAQPGGTVAAWKKYTTAFSAAAFKAAATTVTTTLQACTNCVLEGVRLKHSTAFRGTGVTAMTCKVTDGTNDLTPNFDVYAAVSDTTFYIDGGAQQHTTASAPYTLSCTTNTNLGNSGVSISAATNASPVEFTSTAHGLVNGNSVTISGATGGWTAINGTFTVTKTGDNTFTIPVDSTSFGALSGTVVWAGSFLTAGSIDAHLKYAVLP